MEILTMDVPLWLTILLALLGYIMGAVIQHGNDLGKRKEE